MPNTTPEIFPSRVVMWPLMGISAMRHKMGGGWRLWLLAKNLDCLGRGAIDEYALQDYAHFLEVSPKTYSRWLDQAINLGLIKPVKRDTGKLCLILAGQVKAARIVGCDYVGSRKACTSAKSIVGKGWRAYLWAAYIATFQGRPISRYTMRKIAGVPESTQRAFERKVGVVRIPNYLVSDIPEDHLPGVREFLHPHAFRFWSPEKRAWVVAWRGPDSRNTNEISGCLTNGRSRKVNKALNALHGLSYVGQASSVDSVYLRMFNDTSKQTSLTIHNLVNLDIPAWEVPELFELTHKGPNATFWKVITI